MENNRRFEAQILDSEDYEKTEVGARIVKNVAAITFSSGLFFSVARKYGPRLLKDLSKLVIR